jgi:hypothetical protein
MTFPLRQVITGYLLVCLRADVRLVACLRGRLELVDFFAGAELPRLDVDFRAVLVRELDLRGVLLDVDLRALLPEVDLRALLLPEVDLRALLLPEVDFRGELLLLDDDLRGDLLLLDDDLRGELLLLEVDLRAELPELDLVELLPDPLELLPEEDLAELDLRGVLFREVDLLGVLRLAADPLLLFADEPFAPPLLLEPLPLLEDRLLDEPWEVADAFRGVELLVDLRGDELVDLRADPPLLDFFGEDSLSWEDCGRLLLDFLRGESPSSPLPPSESSSSGPFTTLPLCTSPRHEPVASFSIITKRRKFLRSSRVRRPGARQRLPVFSMKPLGKYSMATSTRVRSSASG